MGCTLGCDNVPIAVGDGDGKGLALQPEYLQGPAIGGCRRRVGIRSYRPVFRAYEEFSEVLNLATALYSRQRVLRYFGHYLCE